ncbi:MAG: hypothetical protein RPR98_09785, partial [Bermanella sp.]
MTNFKNLPFCFLSLTVFASPGYADETPIQLEGVTVKGHQAAIYSANLNEKSVSGSRLDIDII